MSITPEPPGSELPPPLRVLPPISEDTRSRLLQDLGLDISVRDRKILHDIQGEYKNPIEQTAKMATQVFSDLLSSNRGLGEVLNEELGNFQGYPA